MKYGNPINTGKLPFMHEPESAYLHLRYENHPWYNYLSKESGYKALKDNVIDRELTTTSQENFFRPIRITFDVTNLDEELEDDELNKKNKLLKSEILPAISSFYEKALSVVPMTDVIDGKNLVNSTFVHRCFQHYEIGGAIQLPSPWNINNTE